MVLNEKENSQRQAATQSAGSRLRRAANLFGLLLLPCTLTAGTITGVVPLPNQKSTAVPVQEYRGKIKGEVAPNPALLAAVWLEGPQLSAPAHPQPRLFAQTNYQFEQSLLVVAKGTTITFPNRDPDYHNIYSLSRPKRFDLGRYKPGERPAPSVTFDKAGFIALHCEIHEHMRANIVVVDSPFYTVTDETGRFSLPQIPNGVYTLMAQIDRKTIWKIPIEITSPKTVAISFPQK